ncbi:tautomerase family protein [Actinomadura madurae]|uniref:Tautomerase enzyme n=1 Tax=Actinomadura madurae TaxID=1993 RepID=A0A1I5VET4_9ACTN|nr:tautomerase family protein [Actinomadura madurae]MCP9952291.1 tautomerase family protein [Actinomadura madurae]URM97829.1 tautomerase family protein [Actinomadura madurae]SFQ05901.1 Tautomerase enzyme [Actinomadura madurae]
MPHLTVHLPEDRLAGREPELIAALTEAIVGAYGEWARELASVHLSGVPAGRLAQGGKAVDTTVSLVMGVRAAAFDRPEAAEFSAKLAAGLTDAITAVLGEELRPGTTVELVASPQERTFVAGVPAP